MSFTSDRRSPSPSSLEDWVFEEVLVKKPGSYGLDSTPESRGISATQAPAKTIEVQLFLGTSLKAQELPNPRPGAEVCSCPSLTA